MGRVWYFSENAARWAPFPVPVRKHMLQGKQQGEIRSLCTVAELCVCWDIPGEIVYTAGVLPRWG